MRIMTVTGEITPKQAGLTSIHEHVLANMELMEGTPFTSVLPDDFDRG